MKFLLPIVFMALTVSVAEARTSSKQCWDNAQSTMDFNICASKDLTSAQGRLARVTKKLTDTLTAVTEDSGDKNAADQLLRAISASSKTFEASTENDCILDSEMLGGTAAGAEIMGCKTKLSKKRTARFNALIKLYKTQDQED